MDRWLELAKQCGFQQAVELDVALLSPLQMVREACASDKCRLYGKNWTCPPYCGTLEECSDKLHSYRRGILLQTVGNLEKRIDTKGYARIEKAHNDALYNFSEQLRREYPDALCLGAGGCRICGSCGYPEPCRFPGKAISSMEAYGLFVTQVCRDNGLAYYYGPMTMAYTACVLF